MSTPANRTQALTQTILQHYAAGDYSQVEAIARELVSLSPEDGFAWKALGTALCSQNRFDEAVPALQQAVQRMPNNAEAWSNLAQALKILGRLEESIGALQNALRRAPQDANLYNLLGGTLADYGQLDQAFASYRRALELDPYNLAAFSNMLLGYQYHPASDPAFVKAEALRFGETVRRMATPYTDWPNTPDPQRPLNIGLVSADFGSHPVGRFLQGILGRLDQTRYRIVAYSNRNDVEDAITRHIRRKVFLWRAVWGKVDAEVAALIRADQIDILVDLAGHTGGNRLSLFAWKPAPVQVTWLGFFATTGVAEIDYILADRCVLPEDETNHFVEAPGICPMPTTATPGRASSCRSTPCRPCKTATSPLAASTTSPRSPTPSSPAGGASSRPCPQPACSSRRASSKTPNSARACSNAWPRTASVPSA